MRAAHWLLLGLIGALALPSAAAAQHPHEPRPSLIGIGDQVYSVVATKHELRRWRRQGVVDRVSHGRVLTAALEEGLAAVQWPRRRADRAGRDGTGVIVGIVDTGIDWRHPDFLDEDGRTRILWLLDINLDDRPDSTLDIDHPAGALWSRQEIDAALSTGGVLSSMDTVGHGTHVAGIAVGGTSEGWSVSGVAPGADLIVVKASRGDTFSFDEVAVVEAVRFVFERAAALDRPAVVNLSLGGGYSPHDGSSLLEEALAGLLSERSGRVIVASAGNFGAADIHARTSLSRKTTFGLAIEESFPTASLNVVTVELWYDNYGGDAVEVSVSSPGGDLRIDGVGAGTEVADQAPTIGTIVIDHQPSRSDGLTSIVITLQEPDLSTLPGGEWTIEVRGGRGPIDLWLVDTDSLSVTLTRHLSAATTLVVPCTHPSIVCVGASTTRDSWVSIVGPVMKDEVVGDTAWFSARGPTRDGRAKPDLIAPGNYVAAAMSTDASPLDSSRSVFSFQPPDNTVLSCDNHAVTRGTSVATPFVTGTIALMLAEEPDLDVQTIRDRLRASADGTSWHPHDGFGQLDVADALTTRIRSASPHPETSSLEPVWKLVDPARHEEVVFLINLRDQEGAPVAVDPDAIEVRWLGGDAGEVLVDGPWSRRARLPLGNHRGSRVVELLVDGQLLGTTVVEVGRNQPPTPATVAGRGCTQAGSASRPVDGTLLLVLLALGVGRRRRLATRQTGR